MSEETRKLVREAIHRLSREKPRFGASDLLALILGPRREIIAKKNLPRSVYN